MHATATLSLLVVLIPMGALAQPTYTLQRDALGSAGGWRLTGAPFRLGMTAGQPVTGMGAGPARTSPKTYAETVGFWIWGQLPVLDASEPALGEHLPRDVSLSGSTPNPFVAATAIQYAIPTSHGGVRVSIRLYDLTGRLVRVLESGPAKPGVHTLNWDGRDDHGHPAHGGVYFCRMAAGSFQAVRRLVLIR